MINTKIKSTPAYGIAVEAHFKFKHILLIILFIILSVIILTSLINTLQCDEYVIKSISKYDLHNIPVDKLGKGWESKIILPELGSIKWNDYYVSDPLFTKIYNRWTTLCDLNLEFYYKSKKAQLNSISLKDYWPLASDGGNLIKLPVEKTFAEKYAFVTDFRSGGEIKDINWICACSKRNYILL